MCFLSVTRSVTGRSIRLHYVIGKTVRSKTLPLASSVRLRPKPVASSVAGSVVEHQQQQQQGRRSPLARMQRHRWRPRLSTITAVDHRKVGFTRDWGISVFANGTNFIPLHSPSPPPSCFAAWIHHPEMVATAREVTQQTLASVSLDQPSPRPLRKLHHPFKAVPKGKVNQHSIAAAGGSMASSGGIYGAGMSIASSGMSVPVGAAGGSTPPESPTLPGRKIK